MVVWSVCLRGCEATRANQERSTPDCNAISSEVMLWEITHTRVVRLDLFAFVKSTKVKFIDKPFSQKTTN